MSQLVGVVVTLRCQVDSTPAPEAMWYKNGEEIVEDDRVDISRDGGDFELTLNGVFVNDTANYTCSFNNTRIPQVVMATILLEVNEEGTPTHIHEHCENFRTKLYMYSYLESFQHEPIYL